MKVYIIFYKAYEGDIGGFEGTTDSILDICTTKELAEKLKKEYVEKYTKEKAKDGIEGLGWDKIEIEEHNVKEQ